MSFTKAHFSDINGTCLQGELDVSYKELVKAFGKPEQGDGYKVDAEWMLKFDNGVVATIYNYKNGKSYLGKEGTATSKIRDWHIGGYDKRAVIAVQDVLYFGRQLA
jgi:hypothetical protein